MNRRIRDRIYQRKRRLRHQVIRGRITQDDAKKILEQYQKAQEGKCPEVTS